MNFISLFKYLILFSIFFLISCKPVEKIINQNFKKQTSIPEIINQENEEYIFNNNSSLESDLTRKFYLQNIKKSKNIQSKLQTFIFNNEFYTFNSTSEIFINHSLDGKLIKSFQFIENNNNDILISNYYKNNYLILGYSSGKILKTDLKGNIIWEFNNTKIFNSFIYELNDIIFILYSDEIVALDFNNGSKLWSESYEDKPIIQSKGGKIINFFNDIYFVLPNGRLGLIDLFLGSKSNNKFVNLELQSSINNTNDNIYIFKNYIIYLDEGEFLYTYDLLSEEFLLYNFKINSSNSNYFYNNTLIIKNKNYLEAINILNGNSFWLIDSNLKKQSKILNLANINNNLTIFLDNGKIIIITENDISNILDLKTNKIKSINFIDNKIIVKLENGKIGIF